MGNEGYRIFIRALYQLVGNKRYLNDLENLLTRLGDLSPEEDETLLMLARDLKRVDNQLADATHHNFLPFR